MSSDVHKLMNVRHNICAICTQHHTKFTSYILIYKFSMDAVAFDDIYTVFLACSLL